MPGSYRERELKFDVPEHWRVPTLHKLVPAGRVDTRTVRLSSTYYDTADRRLFRNRLTLRRRSGDTDTGWQLKVPDGNARLELSWPLSTEGRATVVPREIREVTAGVRGRAALRPVATLDVVRQIHRLVDRDGTVQADLAVDDVTAVVSGTLTSWREVEVELIDGGTGFLRRASRMLRAADARPAEYSSKLGRALGEGVGSSYRAGSLASLVAAYLDVQWGVIVHGDLLLRTGERPVHDVRVAIRRYRSVLGALAGAFDDGRVAPLDTRLAELSHTLGRVRDAQVLDEQLNRVLAEQRPGVIASSTSRFVTDAVAAEAAAAERALEQLLARPAHAALLAELRDWHEHLPMPQEDEDDAAEHYLRRSVHRARRRLRKASTDEQFHRARKAAKRARYVAELARPVTSKHAKHVVAAQKAVQRRLGERQDAVVSAAFLRLIAASATPAVAFELGILATQARS